MGRAVDSGEIVLFKIFIVTGVVFVITNPEIIFLSWVLCFIRSLLQIYLLVFPFFLIFYRKNTKKIYNSFVILHIFSIVQSNVHG